MGRSLAPLAFVPDWLPRDRHNGLLAEPGEPAALAGKIEMVLSDSQLRERLGAKARCDIEEHCSWDVVFGKTVDVYQRVLNQQI